MNIHEVAKSGKPFRNPSMIGAWVVIDGHFLVHRDNVSDFKDMDWIYENCISNVDKKSDRPVDLYWMTVDDLLRDDWEIVE
jgi:hypothetical protein